MQGFHWGYKGNYLSTNVASLGLVNPDPHGVLVHLWIGRGHGRDEEPGIEVECSPGYGGRLDLQHIRLYQHRSEVCHQLGDMLQLGSVAVWAQLVNIRDDVGLVPVRADAGIRRGITVHAFHQDLLEPGGPVGLALGAGGVLPWCGTLLKQEMAADLLVGTVLDVEECLVLVGKDILHQEGQVLEDPADI